MKKVILFVCAVMMSVSIFAQTPKTQTVTKTEPAKTTVVAPTKKR